MIMNTTTFTMTSTETANAYICLPAAEPNSITFNSPSMVLKLDKDGFHYKGQVVEDAGEAYEFFMAWLDEARRLQQR